jgi:hypothetical protein
MPKTTAATLSRTSNAINRRTTNPLNASRIRAA